MNDLIFARPGTTLSLFFAAERAALPARPLTAGTGPRRLPLRILMAFVLAGFGVSSEAAVLDPIGPTYPIREPSMLEHIEKRLRAMEASGELARLQREGIRRSTDRVRNPPPVPGLSTGLTARTSYYDPSFVLDRNIFDHTGRLMYPAGTRKNPLEVVSWTQRLLFFDARDPRQVNRARSLMAQYGPGGVKPVLVGGSYLELMKQWNQRVYYDQGGALVKRFRITQVPAIVSQEGMRLRIDELETKS